MLASFQQLILNIQDTLIGKQLLYLVFLCGSVLYQQLCLLAVA
jgi:hypothetical protein